MATARARALKQLKLQAVIKESHCSPVQHLDMNLCDEDCRNLFATVAKDQATIYDDQHMGDHVAVVGNLALCNTLEAAKDTFNACCWIKTAGISRHPYGDVLLAIGGSDSHVHIISIVQSAVVGQLPVPAGTSVAELSAAAACPGLLLVVCKDGSLQLWQVATGACLWTCSTDAFTAALHPDGTSVLAASRSGKLFRWDLSNLDVSPLAATAAAAAGGAAAGSSRDVWLAAEKSGGPVDCVRFLTESLVATKTTSGHMAVHRWPSGDVVSSWRVPGSGSSSTPSYSKRCCFGHTRDGRYICVGNHSAAAYAYDSSTGQQLTRVEAIRVDGTVKACGLSEDCRHLLMVVGHGYVFRFEHRASQEQQEEEQQQQQQQLEAEEEEQEGEEEEEEGADAEGPSSSGDGDVDMAAAEDLEPQPQQQQQHANSTPLLGGGVASAAAAGLHGGLQQQLGSFAGLTPGPITAAAQAANSTGSLDALMAVDDTPQADDESGSSRQQQQMLSAGQEKKQRLSEVTAAAEVSPLVFRPTPRKEA